MLMAWFHALTRRSLLWLVPATLIPLGVLLAMQYRFLRDIEQASAVVGREQIKTMLDDVAQDVEQYYRTRAEAALAVCCSLIEPPARGPLQAHFSQYPLAGARLFFVRTFPAGGEESTLFFAAPGAEGIPIDPTTGTRVELATAPWRILAEEGVRIQDAHLLVDPFDPGVRLILRPILSRNSRVTGVAGVMIDEELAHRQLIAPLVRRRQTERFGYGEESFRVTLASADSSGQLATMSDGQSHRLARPFSFLFTDRRLVAHDFCITPEQLASENFRINMIWTGSVAFVLLGSLMMAVRAAVKEGKLSQMKSDFVSNVSHELRTPLSSIRVFGEYMALGRVKDPDKVTEYGRYIEAEGRRLTQLINNILDFSRIESARKKYQYESTDLGELVSEIVEVFRTPHEHAGLQVDLALPSEPLPPFELDRDSVGRALLNLLDNAKKYSNGNPLIEVRLSRADGAARLSVTDHGIGIPHSEQKKIFEKFYRVSTGLVHDVKGSGLGLSIVDHVARAHGGRVEVDSKPGRGSTFTLVLPLDHRTATEEEPRIAEKKLEFET